MSLRLAYNTNGTASHRLDDAIVLLAEAGYDGVALTLDVHHFDPFAPDWRAAADRLARRLSELRLGSVIETVPMDSGPSSSKPLWWSVVEPLRRWRQAQRPAVSSGGRAAP